jgi:hypothetical protein
MNPEKLDLTRGIKKAERFNYGKVSEQVKNLIEILSQPHKEEEKGYIQRIIGKIFGSLFRSEQKSQQVEKVEEIKREKYTQISDRVFEFLTSGAFNNLPENEKEIILFYLLTSPSPREQDKILNSLSFLFKNHESLEIKDLEALEIEKNKLRLYLIFQEVLERARRDGWWGSLLSFYENPENQKIRPDIFQEALEGARRVERWRFYYPSMKTQKIKK